MKYVFKAKNEKATETFKEFHHKVNNKTVKEKLAIASLSVLGVNVKSKLLNEKPYTIKVYYSLMKKMDKSLVVIEQFIPTIKSQWFPDLEYKKDYEVRLV